MNTEIDKAREVYTNNKTKGYATYNTNIQADSNLYTGYVVSATRQNVVSARYNVKIPARGNEVLINIPLVDPTSMTQLHGAGYRPPKFAVGQPVLVAFIDTKRTAVIIGTVALPGEQVQALKDYNLEQPMQDDYIYGSASTSPGLFPQPAAGAFSGKTIVVNKQPWKKLPSQYQALEDDLGRSLAPVGCAGVGSLSFDSGDMQYSCGTLQIDTTGNRVITTAGTRSSSTEATASFFKKEVDYQSVELAMSNITDITFINGLPFEGDKVYNPDEPVTYTFTQIADLQGDYLGRNTQTNQLTQDLTVWLTQDLVGFLLNVTGIWGFLNQDFGLNLEKSIPEFVNDMTDWPQISVGIPVLDTVINKYISMITEAMETLILGAISLIFDTIAGLAATVPIVGGLLAIGILGLQELLMGGRLSLMQVLVRVLEIEDDYLPGPVSFASLIDSLASILVSWALDQLLSLFNLFTDPLEEEPIVLDYRDVPYIKVKANLNNFNSRKYPHHVIACVITSAGVPEGALVAQSIYNLIKYDSYEAYIKALVPIANPANKLILTANLVYTFKDAEDAAQLLSDTLFSTGRQSCNAEIRELFTIAANARSSKQIVDKLKQYLLDDDIPEFESFLLEPKQIGQFIIKKEPELEEAVKALDSNETIEYIDQVTKKKTGQKLTYYPRLNAVVSNNRGIRVIQRDMGYD
jgi:hypothetical protein